MLGHWNVVRLWNEHIFIGWCEFFFVPVFPSIANPCARCVNRPPPPPPNAIVHHRLVSPNTSYQQFVCVCWWAMCIVTFKLTLFAIHYYFPGSYLRTYPRRRTVYRHFISFKVTQRANKFICVAPSVCHLAPLALAGWCALGGVQAALLQWERARTHKTPQTIHATITIAMAGKCVRHGTYLPIHPFHLMHKSWN